MMSLLLTAFVPPRFIGLAMSCSVEGLDAVQVICKATRAWFPWEELRVFPCRDEQYSTGGWYVEWTGHEQQGRLGWLHPGIICLVLGFQALDLEAGKNRPWWFPLMTRRLLPVK
jgi:hypothetical protein